MKLLTIRAISLSFVTAMLWHSPAMALSDAVIAACDAKSTQCTNDCRNQFGSALNPIWWIFGDAQAYRDCLGICVYNYGICIGDTPAGANRGLPFGQTSVVPVTKAAPLNRAVPGVIDTLAQ